MTKITISSTVKFDDGSTNEITATITPDGVIVHYADIPYIVTWELMADVEHLSNLFANNTVRMFKVAVKMLGSIQANQEGYKLLL